MFSWPYSVTFWEKKWVRSRNYGCLVTWFYYKKIPKPGNKTATVSWPDPYCLNSFHTWHLPLRDESPEPYSFSCSSRRFWTPGGQIFARKRVSRIYLTPWPSSGQHNAGFFRWSCSIHNDCKTWIFVEYFWIRWVVIGAGRGAFVLIVTQGLWEFWSIEIDCSHFHFWHDGTCNKLTRKKSFV